MMAAKTNRNVSVNKEFGSLDEALAWAVQKYDTEFAFADMPKITVETVSRTLFQALSERPDFDVQWEEIWIASVTGSFTEE